MDLRRSYRRFLLALVLLAAAFGTLSCAGQETNLPRAWIDGPPDGFQVPVGTPVVIISHGYARRGVAEMLLSVNGQAYRRDAPATAGMFGDVRQEWVPPEDGVYTLQVVTYDSTGAASNPAVITLRVGGEIAAVPTPSETPVPFATPTDTPIPYVSVTPSDTPTPTPTATDTGTPTPTATGTTTGTPTATSTATATETGTPTATPSATPTATNTSTPSPTPTPNIQFWADNTTVAAGSCTNIRWHVSAVAAYWVDGQPGAGDDGSAQTCPCASETHTLTVQKTDGTQQSLQVTINVTGQCITNPPVPQPYVPTNGVEVKCTNSQVLAWLPVSHPIKVYYYVKLDAFQSRKWTQVQTYGPIDGKQVAAYVVCGGEYRWAVRAQDTNGNTSDWSSWSEFEVQGIELY